MTLRFTLWYSIDGQIIPQNQNCFNDKSATKIFCLRGIMWLKHFFLFGFQRLQQVLQRFQIEKLWKRSQWRCNLEVTGLFTINPVQIMITWLWHEFCVLWMFWFGSLNSFLVKQGVNEINIIYNTVGEKDQSKIIVWITIKLYYENSYDFS